MLAVCLDKTNPRIVSASTVPFPRIYCWQYALVGQILGFFKIGFQHCPDSVNNASPSDGIKAIMGYRRVTKVDETITTNRDTVPLEDLCHLIVFFTRRN